MLHHSLLEVFGDESSHPAACHRINSFLLLHTKYEAAISSKTVQFNHLEIMVTFC